MIPSSPICNVCEYSQCGDKCPPTAEQAAKGLNPLSAVPSQLWNSLWHDANAAANCIKFASDTLMCEINSVLTEAGITACADCCNQFASAITCLLQTIDPNGGKSSVKSSITPGMVSIDANGYMTVNNVGNANNLTTTSRVIVDAVNEINSTYGNAYDTLWQNAYDTEEATADNDHASCDTDYGVGTASVYGHLKISDVCNAVLPDCGNVAASQKALADIWAYVNSTTGLGNTLACPLGTATAGTCTTAARSDHVHPLFNYVACAVIPATILLRCISGAATCNYLRLNMLLEKNRLIGSDDWARGGAGYKWESARYCGTTQEVPVIAIGYWKHTLSETTGEYCCTPGQGRIIYTCCTYYSRTICYPDIQIFHKCIPGLMSYTGSCTCDSGGGGMYHTERSISESVYWIGTKYFYGTLVGAALPSVPY